MIVMESLKTYKYILILSSLFIISSRAYGFESEENDYTLLDPQQREIYRRWLSEDTSHSSSHSDNGSHHLTFPLYEIESQMEEIIHLYEAATVYVNESEHDTDHDTDHGTTHTPDTDSHGSTPSPHHRRMRRRLALENEGEWTCTNATHALEEFENVTSLLEIFVGHNCTHSSHSDHAHSHHIPDGVYIVLYCAFVLFIGCILKYFQHRFHIPIPYTVLLLIVGVILELIEIADPDLFGHLNLGFVQVRTIDPHMVLSLFIPGLIFESAFNTNYHIFLKEAQQAAMLAGPGVVVNSLLIGGVMHYFAHSISLFSDPSIDSDGYNWSWSFSIMFGAIVSATDPVAVVALLKELGASKRLSTLIEAESLLNDGTAFVMFTVLQTYAASESGTSFASMLVTFLRLAFGGFAFGILSGTVTYYVLSNIYNDFEIEITISLAFVYLFAYTGDFVLKVSGVLVIVFMGLWTSKNREAISPHVEESMHHFWEMVGFIANTLLFFLTGQVIAFRVASEAAANTLHWGTDFAILIMLYICCHITRALAIWQMHPVLKNTGYGCTFEDSCVMVYGGLRGAIGLALGLIVETEEAFDKIDRDRVLFHVCGIVVLTLVVNAPTVKYLVEYLGLNKPPSDTAALFKSATQHLIDDVHHKLGEMKLDKHYTGANWRKVNELQPRYGELYKSIFDEEMDCDEDDFGDDLSVGEDGDLIINMLAELQRADRENQQKQAVEKRVIQVMKSSYWAQYEKGLISADAVNILVESAEDAIDEHDLTRQRRNLKKWFSIPWYIKWMHQRNVRWVKKLSEWLLFGNLGFAIEVSSGFVYASKSAQEFCHLLKHNDSIENKHVEFVEGQLRDVTDWIEVTSSDVVRVYPEVHTAIQTLHAAHSLLNHQKEEIDHLLHKGFLDEAEHGRVMGCCEHSLNELFHTSYTKLLDKNHDDESILVESPLFSELTEAEKKLVKERAKASKWYKKGDYLMREGKKSRSLFVITRGTIFVYEGNRTHIHTKERGDVLDVYSLLQDNYHGFNFMVATDQCHGYWLDLSLLKLLKDSNIDFWDTLWKCAACDVMRFYFKDQAIMTGTDECDLDNNIYASPLSFFDPHNRYRCEIRVNRGFGVLLNGQVVHITDMNTKATAPAILPVVDEPYVAIEDSVVLYVDFDRQDYHSEKTSHLNPKLAKLMGLAGQTSQQPTIYEGDETDSEFSQIDEEDSNYESKTEDYSEQEKQLLAGKNDVHPTTPPIAEEMDQKEKPVIAKLKTGEEYGSTQKKRMSMKRQASNLHKVDRYRSKNQLNRSAQKEMSTALNEKQLPPTVTATNINDEWSVKECFEVVKFILSKHEGLFDHVKKFHVKHLQEEILKQYTDYSGDESIEMDDEEPIDTDAEQDDYKENGLGGAGGINRPAKSMDVPSGIRKKKSVFARPSSMKFKQKLSMPNMNNPNRDPNAPLPENGQMGSGLGVRKQTLDSNRFRSSRYILSQQKGQGAMSVAMGGGAMQIGVMRKIKKQRSDVPTIIQPKNYQGGKRKSARLSSKKKKGHFQQSTDIDGWENVGNDTNAKVIGLQQSNNSEPTAPLKDDEVNEMEAIIDGYENSQTASKDQP